MIKSLLYVTTCCMVLAGASGEETFPESEPARPGPELEQHLHAPLRAEPLMLQAHPPGNTAPASLEAPTDNDRRSSMLVLVPDTRAVRRPLRLVQPEPKREEKNEAREKGPAEEEHQRPAAKVPEREQAVQEKEAEQPPAKPEAESEE